MKITYNINWKEYSQAQIVKAQNELKKWYQTGKISFKKYNAAKKRIESVIYWKKKEKKQNNARNINWNTTNIKENNNTTNIKKQNNNSTNDYMNSFNKWYWDYIKSQQDIYNIQTNRDLERIARNKEDLDTSYTSAITNINWQRNKAELDFQRIQEDYATFTSQNQQDFNRDISKSNINFSKALSQASSAYWQRWILNSWIQKKQMGEAVWQHWEDIAYFKTLNQRTKDKTSLNQDRMIENYNTNQEHLQEIQNRTTDQYNRTNSRVAIDKANYIWDRSAWSKSLEYKLQAQWDAIFNSGLSSIEDNMRRKAQQTALDKQYWTKTTARKPIYRSWWKYTF